MHPILRAVSRMLDDSPGKREGLSLAELADSLSDEKGLRFATRLALLSLVARCEQADPRAIASSRSCMLCAPLLARRLEGLAASSDDEAMAGLVELAPELRELDATLARDGNPLAVLPRALLELLRARLH